MHSRVTASSADNSNSASAPDRPSDTATTAADSRPRPCTRTSDRSLECSTRAPDLGAHGRPVGVRSPHGPRAPPRLGGPVARDSRDGRGRGAADVSVSSEPSAHLQRAGHRRARASTTRKMLPVSIPMWR
jgi:hypothetical protein